MKLERKTKAVAILVTVLVLSLAMANICPTPAGAEQNPGNVLPGEKRTVYYEVEKGDCLWSIARKYGADVQELARANGINDDAEVLEGQQLTVPGATSRDYSVEQGDTVWGIARKFGIDVETLLEVNEISDDEPLLVGKKIAIPAEHPVLRVDDTNRDVDVDSAVRQVLMPELLFWPVAGQITSVFGPRHGRQHEGLDIAAEEGKPIRAVRSGIVVFAARRGTYGKTVIINHGGGFRSLYAHASSLEVSPGEYVRQGQLIARIGSTGHSTGPHLHLELLFRGTPLDPQKYLTNQDGNI